MNVDKNTVVSLNINTYASNTFVVDTDEGTTLLLTHPLCPNILIRAWKADVNVVNANIKDSTERCIDYVLANKSFLDYHTGEDVQSLGLIFALKRKLTPKQKQLLANISGQIAAIKFNNDLKEAMNFITKNSLMLDDFNSMWFNNFKGLFTGRQAITSLKQRGAIFNIAGYLLAELENPTASTSK